MNIKKQKEMKHTYKSILFVAFGIISLSATAQKDTTLTRQVMLEREYTPTLDAAARINTNPAIYQHTVKPGQVTFVDQAPILVSQTNKLGQVPSGDIGTAIPHDSKIGYLQIAAGTKANIDGAVGVRAVGTDTDQLDIFGTYYSMNGNVNYADKDYLWEKMKAKYSDIRGKIKYEHTFEPAILSFQAGYANTGYNYYGNSFIPKATVTDPYDYATKQSVDVIGGGIGLRSSDANQGWLNYDANIKYDYFKNKYGAYSTDDAMKGGVLNILGDFYGTIGEENNTVGVRASILNQSFSSSDQHMKDTLESFTNVTAAPYFRVEGGHWSTEFGFTASALFDTKNKLFVAPNIKANLNINEVNTLYATVTGNVNNNTFLDVLQENRYTSPLGRVKYSKTQFDLQAGFKSGAVPGLEFDIFGGYKNTKDEHLFIASPYSFLNNDPNATLPIQPTKWGNFSTPVYGNVSTGHFGVAAKTHLIPLTTVSAKVIGYFYSVKDLDKVAYPDMDKKAWGKPTFTADLNVDVKPIDRVLLSVNYLLSGGRKAYTLENNIGKSVSMKDISELNVKLEVQITDWFSVNARANNILNQKYELVQGYTAQGFNALGGLNFKF